MKHYIKTVIVLLLLIFPVSCSYGPAKDNSRFITARLLEDNNTVAFTFHNSKYRMASGINAFPDGGTAKYLRDRHIFGIYDIAKDKHRIIISQKNTDFCNGQGQFYIQDIKGHMILLSQGGQDKSTYQTLYRNYLVDTKSDKVTKLDLKDDFAKLGRDCGIIYLADDSGTIVSVNTSISEANASSAGKANIIPEIWVRTPDGKYIMAARSSHYECVIKGEIYYWEPSTRKFMAFDIKTQMTRIAPEYKVKEFKDVYIGVILSSDFTGLQYGTKTNDVWSYTTLRLKADDLK